MLKKVEKNLQLKSEKERGLALNLVVIETGLGINKQVVGDSC